MPRNPSVRTPEEIAKDQRSFAQAEEVLAGHRRASLNGSSSKLLYILLRGQTGCDATLTEEGFRVQFRNHSHTHEYLMELVPACLSRLLDWCGVASVQGEMRAKLPGDNVDPQSMQPWLLSDRMLWLRQSEGRVELALRELGDLETQRSWPEPIQPPAIVHVWKTYPLPISCPHCQRAVERARDLGSALVCPHCARSFTLP